jgi:hypothetical protein
MKANVYDDTGCLLRCPSVPNNSITLSIAIGFLNDWLEKYRVNCRDFLGTTPGVVAGILIRHFFFRHV